MRVLHVMASGERGGGSDHLAGLVPALRKAGWDCVVACGQSGPLRERLRGQDVPTVEIEMMASRWDPRAAIRLARVARQVGPAVLHSHGTRTGFFVAAARPLLPSSLATVYTVHGLAFRKPRSRVGHLVDLAAEAVACRAARRVISVSRTDLADLVGRGLLRAENGIHIPNAVDTGRFAPRDRGEARRRLHLPLDRFVVGTVARLVAQKAVGELIRAVASCPGVTLVIVGDGPERSRLERLVAETGVDARMLGARDDVDQILGAFDVFALSSRWEGEPIALLEAQAAGLPCVATATTGAEEVLHESGGGLLVRVCDPRAMARALKRLQREPALRMELGQRGRWAMLARDFEQMACRVRAVYAQLLD